MAEEESPRLNANEYRSLLCVDTWTAQVVDATLPLSACAALLQDLEDAETQVSQSIEQYVSGNAVLPDRSKIDSCVQRIRADQTVVDQQEFDRLLEQMMHRMGVSNSDRIRWVSGKHIRIPLLTRLLRKHARCSLRKDSLCFRLATKCEFPDLMELRERIILAAESLPIPADS